MYQTKRLVLRSYQQSDIIPFVALNKNPLVMQYFPKMLTEKESIGLIEKFRNSFNQNGFCPYACELKENKEFIGFVGLNKLNFTSDFTPSIEICWRIDTKYWQMGYAYEAATKCLELGLDCFMLKQIVSVTSKVNYKSINLMLKLNMKYSRDFIHPSLNSNHILAPHVLYTLDKDKLD